MLLFHALFTLNEGIMCGRVHTKLVKEIMEEAGSRSAPGYELIPRQQ